MLMQVLLLLMRNEKHKGVQMWVSSLLSSIWFLTYIGRGNSAVSLFNAQGFCLLLCVKPCPPVWFCLDHQPLSCGWDCFLLTLGFPDAGIRVCGGEGRTCRYTAFWLGNQLATHMEWFLFLVLEPLNPKGCTSDVQGLSERPSKAICNITHASHLLGFYHFITTSMSSRLNITWSELVFCWSRREVSTWVNWIGR